MSAFPIIFVDSRMSSNTNVTNVNRAAGLCLVLLYFSGGTVDITAHEVFSDGNIKEIHAANGDAMGGTKVDENIVKLLEEMLGHDFVQMYQSDCPQEWFRLKIFLEIKKRSIKPSGGHLTIPVDAILGQKYEQFAGHPISDIGKGVDLGYKFTNGVLVVDQHKVRALFEPVVKKIVDHVDAQLQKCLVKCKYLILVGGFGEYRFLQEAIQDRFGSGYIIMVPTEAETTVIRGAVLFGHNPSIVRSRIALMTFGTYSTPTFDAALHDPKYKIQEDGEELCNKVFNTFIEKGQSVETGTTITRYFCPNSINQTKMNFNLYSLDRTTDAKKIEYVESPEFQKIGECVIELPKNHAGPDSTIELEVTFGGTEIVVQVKDAQTEAKLAEATTINFTAM